MMGTNELQHVSICDRTHKHGIDNIQEKIWLMLLFQIILFHSFKCEVVIKKIN